MLTLVTDLDGFLTTRAAWHTLAERVLAPARRAATGRIGLRAAPGGVATPVFDGRTVGIDGTDVVVTDGGTIRRAPITTLGAAAELAGVPLDGTALPYDATTPAAPDTVLTVDPAAAAVLAAWFAFGDAVLQVWAGAHEEETPADVQLWPEHFDLGTDLGPDDARRANYGASPGDADHPLPYLYAGPWTTSDDPFWDAGSYARLGHETLTGLDDPAAAASEFFGHAHAVAGLAKS